MQLAVVSYGGKTFRLSGRVDDAITAHHISRGQFYELETLVFLAELLRRSQSSDFTIIDAGANIGNHSVFLASQFSNSRVLSFEMNPEAFSYLRANIEINNLKNVTPVNCGLSSKSGRCGIKSRVKDPLGGAQLDFSQGDIVELTTLDEYFLEHHGAPKVALLKIDVEGHEIPCLSGAKLVLAEHRPLIFLECKEVPQFHDLVSYLEPLGYEIVMAAEGNLPNFLFAHSDVVGQMFTHAELYCFRKDLCLRHVQSWQLVRQLKYLSAQR